MLCLCFLHKPYRRVEFSKAQPGPLQVARAGDTLCRQAPSGLGCSSTLSARPWFPQRPGAAPRAGVPGRGAPSRAQPCSLLPRDPTCRARAQRPGTGPTAAEGSEKILQASERVGAWLLRWAGGPATGPPPSAAASARENQIRRPGGRASDRPESSLQVRPRWATAAAQTPVATSQPSLPDVSGPPQNGEWLPHRRGAAYLL